MAETSLTRIQDLSGSNPNGGKEYPNCKCSLFRPDLLRQALQSELRSLHGRPPPPAPDISYTSMLRS
jgi:hypothetical protein